MAGKRSKTKLAGELSRFMQQYARKAQKGWDPNDRTYDRKLEQKMKQLKPEELSELLSDSGEAAESMQGVETDRREEL
jgi:hypothetical protein